MGLEQVLEEWDSDGSWCRRGEGRGESVAELMGGERLQQGGSGGHKVGGRCGRRRWEGSYDGADQPAAVGAGSLQFGNVLRPVGLSCAWMKWGRARNFGQGVEGAAKAGLQGGGEGDSCLCQHGVALLELGCGGGAVGEHVVQLVEGGVRLLHGGFLKAGLCVFPCLQAVVGNGEAEAWRAGFWRGGSAVWGQVQEGVRDGQQEGMVVQVGRAEELDGAWRVAIRINVMLILNSILVFQGSAPIDQNLQTIYECYEMRFGKRLDWNSPHSIFPIGFYKQPSRASHLR